VPYPPLENAAYDAIFALACVIWLVLELYYGARLVSEQGATRRDRGSRPIVIGMVAFGFFLAVTLARFVPGAALPGPRPLIFGAGIALMLLGVALRAYAIRILGRYFTTDVAMREGQRVISSGPYRYVRHPSYSGALVTLLGVGLALGSWHSLLALLGFALAGLGYRVAIEERALRETLGKPYEDYMRRTRRFIPFLF
jgi:protein-S-isoprenylcysteine O-methyltransferase Ste14